MFTNHCGDLIYIRYYNYFTCSITVYTTIIYFIQAYKGKSQYKVATDTCEKETPRSSSKRSYKAMEATDLTDYESNMDMHVSESEGKIQDGIYTDFILAS